MQRCVDFCFENSKSVKLSPAPLKTISFDCSSNVLVFSRTPFQIHFWRVRVPTFTQKCNLGAILGFQGSQKRPLGRLFSPKMSQKHYPAKSGERPGADLGATCGPKRPQDTFLLIWDAFCIKFG